MPHSTLKSLRGCWRSTAMAAWGSVSIEADGKCLCCSVIGNALGKCQFVVDNNYCTNSLSSQPSLKKTVYICSKYSLTSTETDRVWFIVLNSHCCKTSVSYWLVHWINFSLYYSYLICLAILTLYHFFRTFFFTGITNYVIWLSIHVYYFSFPSSLFWASFLKHLF